MEKFKRYFIIFWIIVCFMIILASLYVIYMDWKNQRTESSSSEPIVYTVSADTIMTSTTTAQTQTTLSTTTTTELSTTITEITTTTMQISVSTEITDEMTYLGTFIGTYFSGATNPCNGGSGRQLLDCKLKPGTAKGSVASKYVFDNFGYNVNNRTLIWIEFSDYPEMNGWYAVDDCNADPNVVDFYFPDYSQCPWELDGVTPVKVWIN